MILPIISPVNRWCGEILKFTTLVRRNRNHYPFSTSCNANSPLHPLLEVQHALHQPGEVRADVAVGAEARPGKHPTRVGVDGERDGVVEVHVFEPEPVGPVLSLVSPPAKELPHLCDESLVGEESISLE